LGGIAQASISISVFQQLDNVSNEIKHVIREWWGRDVWPRVEVDMCASLPRHEPMLTNHCVWFEVYVSVP